MPCLLCGDICRCSSDANSVASPRWLADATPSAGMSDSQTELRREESVSQFAKTPVSHDSGEPVAGDSTAWRQEVAARLNRYQARRKPRPPRYPSLRLRFEEEPTPAA